MKIEYRKSAAATRAFALITEGWNELVQEGFTSDLLGVCPVDWRNEVLHYERDDGEIIGVLCWRRDGAANAFVVTLGYVEPTSRRRGVFRELHSELRKRADAEGVGRIMFQVHPANVDAVEVARKLGAGLASLSFETILKA